MEDDHIRACKLLDRATAREMKCTTEQVKTKRDKLLAKNRKRVAVDNIVWMSDEMSDSDGESTNASRSGSLTAGDKPSIENPGNTA